MYFKRWGSLAPPPGKRDLKDMSTLLSSHRYYSTRAEGVQPTAFGRAGVQETVPLSHSTRYGISDSLESGTRFKSFMIIV